MSRLFNRFNLSYYQLGLWRVQYLKQRCCACELLPPLFSQNDAKKTPYGNLICRNCHEQINWLDSVSSLTVTASITAAKEIAQKPSSSQLFFKQSDEASHAYQQPNANIISKSTDLPIANSFESNPATTGAYEQPHHIKIPLTSAATYSSYVRGAMIAFKYSESLEALPILIHTLRQLPRPHGYHGENSVILAVPTTKSRLVKRGFDPLAILAFYLSKHWQIPLWTGVSRVDEVSSQQGLSRQERQHNIRNAFKIKSTPPQKRVVLFDDVTTTGSTLTQLAQVMLTTYPYLQISAYTLAQA